VADVIADATTPDGNVPCLNVLLWLHIAVPEIALGRGVYP
jgi:hypothetical protein